MDMLMIRILNENRQIDGTSMNVLVEKPMSERDMPSKTKAAVMGFRLSYFEINHPDNGSPKSELIGIHSNIVPSSASL
jgi:hypothetical protein